MRIPHRRDISARQDLLGKELRQLFNGFTEEDVPDELMKLALQLQGAVEDRAVPRADADETTSTQKAEQRPAPRGGDETT